MLTHFVAYLYKEGLKAGMIKSYLATIRYTQIALGLGNPHIDSMARLEYMVRGIKRLTNGPTRMRLPITVPLLDQMRWLWSTDRPSRGALMLWAAALMCFFGFLRMGEVIVPSGVAFNSSVHLSVADVSVDSHASPMYVAVNIKAPKTDPFRQGVTIYLGRTYCQICPVSAVLRYLVERRSMPGPLFTFRDGKFLTRERFVLAVREALATTGMDTSKYSGHSFRIGAATTAAERGIQDSLIKTIGRWESSAYLLYIRTPRNMICSIAKMLLSDKQEEVGATSACASTSRGFLQ